MNYIFVYLFFVSFIKLCDTFELITLFEMKLQHYNQRFQYWEVNNS